MSEVVIADIDAKNMVHLFTEDNEHFDLGAVIIFPTRKDRCEC